MRSVCRFIFMTFAWSWTFKQPKRERKRTDTMYFLYLEWRQFLVDFFFQFDKLNFNFLSLSFLLFLLIAGVLAHGNIQIWMTERVTHFKNKFDILWETRDEKKWKYDFFFFELVQSLIPHAVHCSTTNNTTIMSALSTSSSTTTMQSVVI